MSLFRDEKSIIEEEFKKGEWYSYWGIYSNLESIVKSQRRDVLDMKINDMLLKNISMKSSKKVYLSTDKNTIYSYHNNDTSKEIPISEAIKLFNHDALEEAFEKTSAFVG
jgi:hypothetical protein